MFTCLNVYFERQVSKLIHGIDTFSKMDPSKMFVNLFVTFTFGFARSHNALNSILSTCPF